MKKRILQILACIVLGLMWPYLFFKFKLICFIAPCDRGFAVKAEIADPAGKSAGCRAQLLTHSESGMSIVREKTFADGRAHFVIGPWQDIYYVQVYCPHFNPSPPVEVDTSKTPMLDIGDVTLTQVAHEQ